MDKFGHFFEFFAALNSAYIVSDAFLRAISNKVNIHFTQLDSELRNIINRQKETESLLLVEIKKGIAENLKKAIGRLNNSSRDINNNIDSFKTNLKSAKISCSISRNFNFICLYASLYCITILILNGFGFEFDSPLKGESFLLFNIASILMIAWIMWENKKWVLKKARPSYNKMVIIFFSSFLAIPALYILGSYYPGVYWGDFALLNVIISLLIPTSHLFYFFFKISYKTRNECKILKPTLREIKKSSENFAMEMNITFSVINDISITES